jgi:hypothetical protein
MTNEITAIHETLSGAILGRFFRKSMDAKHVNVEFQLLGWLSLALLIIATAAQARAPRATLVAARHLQCT